VLWTGLGHKGTWAFLDLTGGAKPYLLTRVDNHRGAVTTLTWSTSTAYATASRLAGRPWRTALPFPVHVVASSRTEERFSGTVLTTGFGYGDGYWDPVDREFRGFGRVEQTDTLLPATAPPPAPPSIIPLDPVVPAALVPAGFDAAANGNLLRNWSFDTPGGTPSTTLTTTTTGTGDAAAAGWTVRNQTAATTVTEVVSSDLPHGRGGRMLHVTTDGAGCGVGQQFLGVDTGPQRAVASVWLKLVRGAVRLGSGNGGESPADATWNQPGQWVLVQTGNRGGPVNQFTVLAEGVGGAEFYVDHAWLRVDDVPAEPVDTAPVRTVTWFALGPVGPAAGDWTAVDPTGDYWAGDRPLSPPLDLSALPVELPRSTLREAVRAVRGRTLRTEVYADDGDPLRGSRPYEVRDTAVAVVPVLDGRDGTDAGWRARPVVTVHDVVFRHSTWDRGEEPMVRITASGGFDAFGRPGTAVDLGVARGRDPRAGGTPCLATVTTTEYATRDDAVLYRRDRVARTARHELVDLGTGPVLDLVTAALAGTPTGDLRSLELRYYDGPEFSGLDLGQLGDHGLPVRTEQLVLTPERLAVIAGPLVLGGSTLPPPSYLLANGDPADSAAWPVAYAPAFRDSVVQAPDERGNHVGYVWHPATGSTAAGYYAQTSRTRYDVQAPVADRPPRGLALVARDPWAGEASVGWDDYDLLATSTTDAAGCSTTATYDYRVMKPREVTDANGNRSVVGYTPLGLPAWTARLGKADRSEGDTVQQPGERFEYALTAYDRSLAEGGDPQPMSVSTLRRVDHRWTLVDRENTRRAAAGDSPLDAAGMAQLFGPAEHQDHPERFVRSVEYSDGLGRLLQTRTQADDVAVSGVGLPDDPTVAALTVTTDPTSPGPAVVVTGWQLYDIKGRPAVTYEPVRDLGWGYAPPSAARLGGLARVVQHHDPLGRPTVTLAPDGSQIRIVRGRPTAPHDPGSAVPTPWETWTYDAEDNAGRTHPTESFDSWHRWNTPSSAVVDALGRTIVTVQRGLAQDVVTATSYDIDGRRLSITDALGRQSTVAVYDLLGRPWATWLLDGGTRRTVHDAADGVVECRDDKGGIILTGHDRAHRRIAVWAADRRGQSPTLRQVSGYGDDPARGGLTVERAVAMNARGRVVVQYDEAGLLHTGGYDLDGNTSSTVRRVLEPALLLTALPASGAWSATAYSVDWQPPPAQTVAERAAQLLEGTEYVTDSAFDALGRRTSTMAPTDATGQRARIAFEYGRSGGLISVSVDGVPLVRRVVHDAHGRRSVALLGNGILLRYRYDPRTFRLRRLRAEHATPTAAGWTCDGPVLQDQTFRSDRMGRLLTLADRTPGCGLPLLPDRLDRQFTYDGLGRLASASGRETDLPPARPWSDVLRGTDVTRGRPYVETFAYDVVGTLLSLQHATDPSGTGAYTRTWSTDGGNRATALVAGPLTVPYGYDECGNITTEADNRFLEWDSGDRLATFRDQAGAAAPSVYAQYRYDTAGQRVLKLVRRSSGPDLLTVYVGGFERVLRGTVGGALTPFDELHLTDQGTRLATVRRGAALPGDPFADPVRYQLTDQLGSVTATLGSDGGLLNREDNTAYGETSFGSYARKRYRFTGKERDEESGLAYHGARYYSPWLARWTSIDPVPRSDGTTEYAYAGGNPMRFVDPDGRAEQTPASAPAADGVKPRGGDPRVNAAVGEQGALAQQALLESKGMTIEGREIPVEGGRIDVLTSKVGKGLRALEQKTLTAWKKGGHYLTEKGQLIVENVDARLRSMLAQVQRHLRGLAQARAADPTVRLPTSENILITVRAPEQIVEQVRARAQALAAGMETSVEGTRVGIGVISERAVRGAARGPKGSITLGTAGGMALGALGVAITVKHMSDAAEESTRTGSSLPVVEQGAREAGGWVGGALGGAALGAAFGIETGPGAIVTGLIGGVVGGVFGYEAVDQGIEELHSAGRDLSRSLEQGFDAFVRPFANPAAATPWGRW
jgi:RHS repeat-associated protein